MRKQTKFEDLVLDDTPAHVADEDEAARALAAAAAERLERVLPPADSPAGEFRTRVRCLRGWMPELGLPSFEDADLRPLLEQLCRGLRSLEQVRAATGFALEACDPLGTTVEPNAEQLHILRTEVDPGRYILGRAS